MAVVTTGTIRGDILQALRDLHGDWSINTDMDDRTVIVAAATDSGRKVFQITVKEVRIAR